MLLHFKKKKCLMPVKHPPEISINLKLPIAETEIGSWLLIWIAELMRVIVFYWKSVSSYHYWKSVAFMIPSHFTIGLISVLCLSPDTLWYEFLRKWEKNQGKYTFFFPFKKICAIISLIQGPNTGVGGWHSTWQQKCLILTILVINLLYLVELWEA